MAQYYQKINTLYFRNENTNVIEPERGYVKPEFELLKNVKWECTEKIDGTNMSVHISTNPAVQAYIIDIHGKTEKANIPPHLLKKMQTLFTERNIINAFGPANECKSSSIILHGEGYGVKIQSGGNYIKDDVNFILFDVQIGDWWLERSAVEEIADKLGIQVVPLIGYMTIPEAEEYVKVGFKSTIAENKNYDAEGLVLRAPLGLRDRAGSRLIVKIKTCDWRKLENKQKGK